MLYQVETKLRKADEQYEAHVDATLKKRITRLEAENGVESDTAVQSAKATSDQNDVEKKAEHAKKAAAAKKLEEAEVAMKAKAEATEKVEADAAKTKAELNAHEARVTQQKQQDVAVAQSKAAAALEVKPTVSTPTGGETKAKQETVHASDNDFNMLMTPETYTADKL